MLKNKEAENIYSIYLIKNSVNDKCYVGKTSKTIYSRFQEHKRDAKKSRAKNRPLYSAMNKYGSDKFNISLIEYVPSDMASEREVYWIKRYDSYNNGYNATFGGDGKQRINHCEVIKCYEKIHSIKETAETLNISPDTVSDILKSKNVKTYSTRDVHIQKHGKKIKLFNADGICLQIFPSAGETGGFICRSLNLSNKYQKQITSKILDICNHKNNRHSVYGYTCEYV